MSKSLDLRVGGKSIGRYTYDKSHKYFLSTSILQIFPLFQKINKLRTAVEGVRVFEIVKIYVKIYITYTGCLKAH